MVTITSITANATLEGDWFAKNTQTGHDNTHVKKKEKKKGFVGLAYYQGP